MITREEQHHVSISLSIQPLALKESSAAEIAQHLESLMTVLRDYAQNIAILLRDGYVLHGMTIPEQAMVLSFTKSRSDKNVDPSVLTEDDIAEILDTPIADTGMTIRTRNQITNIGINTVRDLAAKTQRELKRQKNFGKVTLTEIKSFLAVYGLQLAEY